MRYFNNSEPFHEPFCASLNDLHLLHFVFLRGKEDATQSTALLQSEHGDSKQGKRLSEDKTFAEPSESEKEEGNYEELVCLVRQFYVERPVNPAAIAYHNIETC